MNENSNRLEATSTISHTAQRNREPCPMQGHAGLKTNRKWINKKPIQHSQPPILSAWMGILSLKIFTIQVRWSPVGFTRCHVVAWLSHTFLLDLLIRHLLLLCEWFALVEPCLAAVTVQMSVDRTKIKLTPNNILTPGPTTAISLNFTFLKLLWELIHPYFDFHLRRHSCNFTTKALPWLLFIISMDPPPPGPCSVITWAVLEKRSVRIAFYKICLSWWQLKHWHRQSMFAKEEEWLTVTQSRWIWWANSLLHRDKKKIWHKYK